MYSSREDYNSPEYKSWRNAVYARDKFTCQKCNRGGVKLNCHHIKKWAIFPTLRYKVWNGITLCEDCHNLVTGKEESYEREFEDIVRFKKIQNAKQKGKKINGYKKKWKRRNPRLRI